jgi:hypothetical protein
MSIGAPTPPRVPHRTGPGLCAIQPRSGKRNSEKFAFLGFSEVHEEDPTDWLEPWEDERDEAGYLFAVSFSSVKRSARIVASIVN